MAPATTSAACKKTKERAKNDGLQSAHWNASLLKRWLLGTHAGAVRPQHLQAYLDEFVFRYNRRTTIAVQQLALGALQLAPSRGLSQNTLEPCAKSSTKPGYIQPSGTNGIGT
ncbi:MAG: transposase [Alphaproteobacteria bacterium]|nr:transposase [Alphaproteobacteria bacterium]